MVNFPLPKTLFALCLMILISFVASAAMAAEVAEKTYEWADITISFTMVLSWLLVPIAWAITEYAPVPSDSKPMIPVVFGLVASTVGHIFFDVDVVQAQMQFAAALAAGNMNGFMKKFIPWVVNRFRSRKNKPPTPE